MRKLLIISLLLFPVVTLASSAAWCLVRDEVENCGYKLAEDCYKHAGNIGGYCRPNARFLGSSGDSRWCVVSASGRNCNFRGQRRCLSAARKLDGGCVENVEEALRRARMAQTWEMESGSGDLADELQSALQEQSAMEEQAAAAEEQQVIEKIDP
jgi:hypothetical protein